MKQKIKKILKIFTTFVFSWVPIKENKFIFESGRQRIDDNPKYFYLHLKENFSEEYDLKFFAYRGANIQSINPKDIVYYNTFAYYYHLASTKFLIRSHSINANMNKRKKQVYIQLWHGADFKNCEIRGLDVSRNPVEHVREWDLFVANDDFQKEVITRHTGYRGRKVTLGLPRTDYIIKNRNSSTIELKKELGLPTNKKIILYAPTFRDWDLNQENTNISVSINEVIDAMDPNSVLVLRLHPQIKNFVFKRSDKNKQVVFDMSKENDLEKILIVSDMMISDYSSILYDFAILERPIVLYAHDFEKYTNQRGGFYFDFETDLPAITAYNFEELKSAIEKLDKNPLFLEDKFKIFNNTSNKNNDGNVCARLIEYIQSTYIN